MISVFRAVALLLLVSLLTPRVAWAQAPADVWRTFAEKVGVGTEITVRLRDGQRFRATLVGVGEDALMVQPKTRVPVPVQPVPYDAVLSLEQRKGNGANAAKVAAIGVATGVGAFLAVLGILAAVYSD